MDPEYRRDTKKVVKMLSIVVAVFAVLDLPIHIVWIWQDFFNGSDGWYIQNQSPKPVSNVMPSYMTCRTV